MAKSLIIVESPAKAKTIAKYLGKDFMVESSIGHIRDLPGKGADIPPALKKKKWAKMGVDVDNDFEPLYLVPAEKRAQVKKLKDLLESASTLFLATDEDREGEAIAWHLKEVLKPKVPTKRMVFHEITEAAIKQALKQPREIDEQLVDAQEARRILDRLVGFEVSPVLWRKIRQGLSVGRVQSVAVRLTVERERLRIAFRSGDYWSVDADAAVRARTPGGAAKIKADVVEVAGKRIALGKDFDPDTGALRDEAKGKVVLLNEATATKLKGELEKTTFTVSDVQKKPYTERPVAPFITSTLQQEANKKLRFTAQRAMRNAQRLYESGFITYMRTDSTTLSTQAVNAARAQIAELYGNEYLPAEARTYDKKAKGAQEAHEAIRPAGETFRTPESVRGELDEDQFKLYDLIWKRTVASQMKDAHGERTQVRLSAQTGSGETLLQASGKVIAFPGFLRAYVEGSDDPDAELEDQERVLPPVQVGDVLDPDKVRADGHATQPPARFTEASLVKELEEKGIGRPSTYASIISTVQDRGYVFKKGNALVPTFTAFAVINLLEVHFKELVDYAFTASMETDLDAISDGTKEATPWLKHFYWGASGKGTTPAQTARDTPMDSIGLIAKVTGGLEDINPRDICELPLGRTDKGELVAARVGKYGPYVQVGDTDRRANIPDDTAPDELTVERALKLLQDAADANKEIGKDEATGKPIFVKTGRFGPYVMLGEASYNDKGKPVGEKPRMASLWPGMTVQTITFEQALLCLSFPKDLGKHPDTGVTVMANDGKFGPYLSMEGVDNTSTHIKETRSLTDREMLRSMTLEQAVEVLKQPRVRGRGAAPAPVAILGTSPITNQQVLVKTGKFGFYVTDGVVNTTLPGSRDPQKVSLEDALEFIAQREQRLREQGIDARAPVKGKGGGRTKRAAFKPTRAAPTTAKAPAKTAKPARAAKKLTAPPKKAAKAARIPAKPKRAAKKKVAKKKRA